MKECSIFDGELERMIRDDIIDLEVGLSFASNAGKPPAGTGRPGRSELLAVSPPADTSQ